MMVGKRVDHPQGPAFAEQIPEVPGDEELGDRHQRVEERTHAEDLEDDLERAGGGLAGVGDRTDRGDRVEGPLEREADRHALDRGEADCAGDEQDGDQHAQQGEAAKEEAKLSGTGGPRPGSLVPQARRSGPPREAGGHDPYAAPAASAIRR